MKLIDLFTQATIESGIDGYVLPDHGLFIEVEDLVLDRAITLKEVYLGIPFVWDSKEDQLLLDNWSYSFDGTWHFNGTPHIKKTAEGWSVEDEMFSRLSDAVEHVEKSISGPVPRATSYHFKAAEYKTIVEDILRGLRDETLYAAKGEMGIRIVKPRKLLKDRCVAQVHADKDLCIFLPGKPITISIPRFVEREIRESLAKRVKEKVQPVELEIWKRMIK